MLIGFCYDLKSDYLSQGYSNEECLELDSEETIDAITATLKELGHNVEKIGNIKSLVKRLANEDKPAWDLVFNVSEVIQHIPPSPPCSISPLLPPPASLSLSSFPLQENGKEQKNKLINKT